MRKADDLFEKSSMSFGDHLEELRRALGKALLWVMGGMAISMWFATSIVRYIQVPLQSALEEFYVEKAASEWEKVHGKPMPEEMKQWMLTEKFVSEDIYIEPELWNSLLAPVSDLKPGESADIIVSPSADVGTADIPRTAPESASQSERESSKTDPNSGGQTPESYDDESSEGASPSGEIDDTPPKSAALALGTNTTLAQDQNETSDTTAGDGTESGVPPNLNDGDAPPDPSRLRKIRIWSKIAANTEALSLQEPFMIWLKAALVSGILIASPGIFYSIWQFVAAGLYPHERKYVYFFLPVGVGLFVGGASLAFFVVFRLVISFLLTFNESLGIGASPRLNEYMSFVLVLPIGFGIAFQLPLVMLVLERIGVFSVQTYLDSWRVAVMVIAFLSMILTPAEPTSMIAMLVPLVALYYLGIAMCKFLPRRGEDLEGAYDPE